MLASGARTQEINIPDAVSEQGGFGWQPVFEDATHFLFIVEYRLKATNSTVCCALAAQPIRCSVTEATCERAGVELVPGPGDDVQYDFIED